MLSGLQEAGANFPAVILIRPLPTQDGFANSRTSHSRQPAQRQIHTVITIQTSTLTALHGPTSLQVHFKLYCCAPLNAALVAAEFNLI